jgi:hypothetical protein
VKRALLAAGAAARGAIAGIKVVTRKPAAAPAKG